MVPERCLDSQLWHACAGGMVQMPSLNSKVFYFPQGHAEHAQGSVDFGACKRIPAMILCKVAAIKFMAERDTDEVFVKMHLMPVGSNGSVVAEQEDDDVVGSLRMVELGEKPASFAKTLTQSDANNGGGFSVPRYCAETIFPRLDYSSDPPVQTILARDVHGEVWKFRHIYRGTPRRHLLTTGWSTFVNQKKLVAGDSVVFLRANDDNLCIGIRRAKRGIGSGLECPVGWNSPFGGFPCSSFFREGESKMLKCTTSRGGNDSGGSGRWRITAESVVEAATLAASGQPFEVVYYPRASTPEFCVKASAVRDAMKIRWSSGMRFKMAFETEDSSRISWFMGTVSGVQAIDPARWPASPWRILQVRWDEPELLHNVKVISPWLVELASNFPAINIPPFSPPPKKLRLPQEPELPFSGQLSTTVFPTNLWPSSSSLRYPLDGTPAGIQGARHALIDTPLSDLHLHRQQSSVHLPSANYVNYCIPLGPSSLNLSVDNPLSCSLMTGKVLNNVENSPDAITPKFMLFGQPILTEEQLCISSGDTASAVLTANSLSEGNTEKSTNFSDGSGGSTINQQHSSYNSSCDRSLQFKELRRTDLGLESRHSKVFMESENVGRILDLSSRSSYDELQKRLVNMYGVGNLKY